MDNLRAPLAFRLSDSILKPKRGLEETYRVIRNRLRRYSATSIVELALAKLSQPSSSTLEDNSRLPWITLLIVKWALQDPMVLLRVGPPITVDEFEQIVHMLWEPPDSGENGGFGNNVFLALRSFLNVQMDFQRRPAWTFLRWPALYARLPEGKSRQQFRTAVGMDPNTYMDLMYGLISVVLTGKGPLQPDALAPCRPHYGDAVDTLYAIFVRDLVQLRSELQSDAAQRIRGRHELYEFPYLKRFPLVRMRDGLIHCWHRQVFTRSADEIVHLRLSAQFGEEYSRLFSLVFESYVTELVAGTGLPHITEDTYKQLLGKDAHAVEAILDAEECNVLIEAKMSLFADDVLIQDDETRIYEKTKNIRNGIKQGWHVGRSLREHHALKDRFTKPQDFLLIVTSRDLLIGGGEMLERLYSKGRLNYPADDPAAPDRLPLRNIFIMCIEDFERFIANLKLGTIDLKTFLEKAATDNQFINSGRLYLSEFLGDQANANSLPPLLAKARDEAEIRIKRVFQGA